MSSYSRPLPHSEYLRLKYAPKADEDHSSSKGGRSKSLKSKNRVKRTNIKIVDHDVVIRDVKKEPGDDDDDDDMAYAPREDKPTIAGIVDERPNHLIRKDLDRNRWRTLSAAQSDLMSSEAGKDNNEKRNDKSRKRSDTPDHARNRRRGSGDDSDLSPPRTLASRSSKKHSQNRTDNDSDLSPPRTSNSTRSPVAIRKEKRSQRRIDDDDLSPPRQAHDKSSYSSRVREQDRSKGIESVRKDGRAETLSGKVAGLSDSKSVRDEMKRLQEREAQLMQRLGDDALGRNAKTVFRDRGTGRIRDLEAEAAVSVKTDKEEEERAIRYKDWSSGLHQRQERSQRLQQDLKEMDKPLSRYEDDEDRDAFLKGKELAEDPMLQFVRRKKLKEKVREAADKGELVFRKPVYRGPPPPPNRFSILPGHRWDGVDRSNGYEKKLMDKQAERIAVQEDAYKWSTEDM